MRLCGSFAVQLHWPFPRRRHARAIDRLRRDGARVIVYDVQFTEQTTPRDDNALISAIDRAHNVVLGTAETDEAGHTNVLGGAELLASIGARVGASNFPEEPGGAVARVEHSHAGLRTLAVVTAGLVGRAPPAAEFEPGGAWIDFHGPPGTIDAVSFSDLVRGRVPSARVRGRILVIGASSPTLRGLQPTPAGGLMSGPELQANAIDTAIRDLPLRGTPQWAVVLIVIALAVLPALLGLFLRALVAPVIAVAYLLVSQIAFDHGRILPVAVPLFALSVATVSTVAGAYVAERWERRRVARQNEELEAAVRERTAELRAAQAEVIHHLAQAVESRDHETGLHLERIGRLCELVGAAMGMSAGEAETLRNASLLHDVRKVGVPDAILHQRASWRRRSARS
jgi:CHASE2 domain-containing sensor protein